MNNPVNLFHLLDGVLQLPVEHTPIRHNDDGVEDPMRIRPRAIQVRQQVRQPRDGVRFPAPCGVLDEVVVPDPFFHDSGFQLTDDIKLMVSRENEHSGASHLSPSLIFGS